MLLELNAKYFQRVLLINEVDQREAIEQGRFEALRYLCREHADVVAALHAVNMLLASK